MRESPTTERNLAQARPVLNLDMTCQHRQHYVYLPIPIFIKYLYALLRCGCLYASSFTTIVRNEALREREKVTAHKYQTRLWPSDSDDSRTVELLVSSPAYVIAFPLFLTV